MRLVECKSCGHQVEYEGREGELCMWCHERIDGRKDVPKIEVHTSSSDSKKKREKKLSCTHCGKTFSAVGWLVKHKCKPATSEPPAESSPTKPDTPDYWRGYRQAILDGAGKGERA